LAAIGGEPLAGLVNNAGIAVVGPLELVPIEDWRRQFEVNVLGLVAMTQAFLPLLRAGRGRIVNIGSIAGRIALPGSGAYDSSKFAVEAITDALRLELASSKIPVSIIEPGSIATPIWQKSIDGFDALSRRVSPERYPLYAPLMAKIKAEAEQAARRASPVRAVVKAVEHAMISDKPKTRYPIGSDPRFWLMLNLLPDKWRDWLILKELNR
jgi:NAD(P)-dependent dehydrogenase (short-subunit alcohol dehydrogenase family)